MNDAQMVVVLVTGIAVTVMVIRFWRQIVAFVVAVALLASRLRGGSLTTPAPMSVTVTRRTPRPLGATGASIPGGGA